MDNNTQMGSLARRIKNENPTKAGIKLFFADAGLSTAIGFIVGMLLGAAKLTTQESLAYVSIAVGLLVSLYTSFLLYRQYSSEIIALIALMVTALISSLISFPSTLKVLGLSKAQLILLVIATMAMYGIGWYLAKVTNLKVFLFGRKWVIAFVVIGIITFFLELVGFISFLTK